MKAKFLVPLALFLLLAGFLGYGLTLNPRDLPSPLIDKPAPDFRLVRLDAPEQYFALADMRGKVWLLNVWASWCVACRQEHPVLVKLSQQGVVPIIGLNYKDVTDDAKAWLQRYGDPYTMSIVDADGRVGIDFGVYGVPETFLIDKAGMIRYKQIGPVTPDVLKNVLLPKIAELSSAK